MPLAAGAEAPDFTLPDGDGSDRSLAELTAKGPALLVFFKTSCPVCKMAFPVYSELARRYGDEIPVVAVSQNPEDEAVTWLEDVGFEGTFLLDDADGHPTSKAYEITSVPTLVLVEDAKVVAVAEGWDRQRANAFASDLGERTGRDTSPVSVKTDGRPPWRPG